MKIVTTDHWTKAHTHFDELREMGHEPVFYPDETKPLEIDGGEIDALICNWSFFLYHDIKEFPNLQYLQLVSAGFNHVPLDYLKEHDITWHNARGVYSAPIAEHVLASVLYLYKHIGTFVEQQKTHEYIRWNTRELGGKTVCIVGCGSVGTEIAKRFAAFDSNVIGCDLYPSDNPYYQTIYPLDQLNDLIAKSDILVMTVPLSDETFHMISDPQLELLKSDAILVNVARGPIIDTNALLPFLQQKKIFGAVLDVHEQEPLAPDSPIWDLENVIVTPHNSFLGEHNDIRMWEVIRKNLQAYDPR